MVDIDRMIARLGELVHDAYATSALGSGSEHGIAEILLAYHLRAGESEEDAARTYLLECLGIELGVTAKGITQSSTMLGKGRRVEDDEVVLPSHAVEILEGIFGKGFMAGIAGEIKLYIGTGEVDGLG